MKLSFSEDKFILRGPFTGTIPQSWAKASDGSVTTKSIRAAVGFRKYADAKAERIFSRFMLIDYFLPDDDFAAHVPEGLKLYAFQARKGIPFILSRSRSYLAHEPGLGKSAQAICAVNYSPGPCLIICPSFLKINWAREITKWSTRDFPDIQILEHWSEDVGKHQGFTIVSDALLAKAWVVEKLFRVKFKYIFIDEAHRFKTPEASRTVALFGGANGKIKSPGLIYEARHVCLLSGTPLLNRPIELWPMLYAMVPELIDFKSYLNFGFRYGGGFQDERGRWHFTGSANEAELNTRIVGRFMQRIEKADVLTDLPPKIREAIFLDTDPRAEKVKALDQSLKKQLTGSFEIPRELGDFALVRHANGMAKIKYAAEFVSDILDASETEQVLVYAHHRDVVEGLRLALAKYVPLVINGSVAMPERTKMQDLFQAGARRLLIGNIDSMSLGLTLTKGTRAVFVEYAWTPAQNEQAEDRLHRIGQKGSVFAQYLVLPNSIDEMILNAVLTKQEVIRKVLSP